MWERRIGNTKNNSFCSLNSGKKVKNKGNMFFWHMLFGSCFMGHALVPIYVFRYHTSNPPPMAFFLAYAFQVMLFRSCFGNHICFSVPYFQSSTNSILPHVRVVNKKLKKNLLSGYQPVNSHAKKNKIIKCNTEVLVLYNIQLYNMMNSFIKIKKYWIILKNIILVEHFILSGKKMSFIVFFACALWVHFH